MDAVNADDTRGHTGVVGLDTGGTFVDVVRLRDDGATFVRKLPAGRDSQAAFRAGLLDAACSSMGTTRRASCRRRGRGRSTTPGTWCSMLQEAAPRSVRAADPVAFETLRRALETVGDEMAIALARPAFSPAAAQGICSPLVAVTNTPVEVIERETPPRVTRSGFVSDSCGAGTFRGGLAVERRYRLDRGRDVVQVRSDRAPTAPYGLSGGGPGAVGRNLRQRRAARETLRSRHTTELLAGDEHVSVLPGAGGGGDPLERDPQLVRDDVRDEKITPRLALATLRERARRRVERAT